MNLKFVDEMHGALVDLEDSLLGRFTHPLPEDLTMHVKFPSSKKQTLNVFWFEPNNNTTSFKMFIFDIDLALLIFWTRLSTLQLSKIF